MNKNNDVIMISETDSEYIEKIILIINKDKKRAAPRELLIKQAEKIICEYEKKSTPKKNSLLKAFFLILTCAISSFIACFLGIRLFC